jgi:hypothetical protein
MRNELFALSLGFAGLILWTDSAAANPPCAPRADVVAHLGQKYSETRRSMGLAANSTVMEVFASEATGTWTITVTTPQGITCLIASGQSFEAVVEQQPAKGSPA